MEARGHRRFSPFMRCMGGSTAAVAPVRLERVEPAHGAWQNSLVDARNAVLAAVSQYDQASNDAERGAAAHEMVRVLDTYVKRDPDSDAQRSNARALAQAATQYAPLKALRLQAAMLAPWVPAPAAWGRRHGPRPWPWPRAAAPRPTSVVSLAEWSRLLADVAPFPMPVGATLAGADERAKRLAAFLWNTAPVRTLWLSLDPSPDPSIQRAVQTLRRARHALALPDAVRALPVELWGVILSYASGPEVVMWAVALASGPRALCRFLGSLGLLPARRPGALTIRALKAWLAPLGRTESNLAKRQLAWAAALPCTGVLAVSLTPDGRRALTGANDHTARLWDLTDPKRPELLFEHDMRHDWVRGVALSNNGRRALIVSNGRVKVLDLTDLGHPQWLGSFPWRSAWVTAVTWLADGRRALISYDHAPAELWDLTDPAHPHRLTAPPIFHVEQRQAMTLDGSRLLEGRDDHARLWDYGAVNHPEFLADLGHQDSVAAVALTPDGRRAVTGSDDLTAKVWHLADPKRPRLLAHLTDRHEFAISVVALTPDASHVITVSRDATNVWSLQ